MGEYRRLSIKEVKDLKSLNNKSQKWDLFLFDIKIIINIKYINRYIITGIIAEAGLSKKDLFLNNIIGKKAINRFKNKFNIFLSSWLFIYLVLVAAHETHVSACGIFHCSAQAL